MRLIGARVRSAARLALGLVAGAFVVPGALAAQSRQLDWPAIHVSARLDAEGRLYVREEQVMRLSGDWNGGERSFRPRPGQELALSRITRLDADGTERELVAGDLDAVDHFDWTDRNTLRWRSRLPSDPPFDGTRITYALEYSISNILQPQADSSFLLDHDFAFADRVGLIDTLVVELKLDPLWRAEPGFTGRYSATALPPGQGFVVTVPLTYLGTVVPAGVRYGADETTRDTLAALFVLVSLVLLARLFAREHRLGRFSPLPGDREITAEFLAHNVFSRLPEVVGAAWDDTTAAPEVAATLARLVGEKKLSSRVEEKRLWIFNRSVLHLEMQVPRDQFKSHERALIDGLFRSNETTTDTEKVRKRYEKSGFDPAALIRKRVEKLVEDTTPGSKGSKPSIRPTLLLLLLGAIVMAWRATQDSLDAGAGLIVVLASLGVYVVAASQSAVWRSRVSAVGPHALRFLVPLALGGYVYVLRVLYEGRGDVSAVMLVGFTLWMLGLVNSVCNQAQSRQSPERIALRKRLAAARRFFRRELAKPNPSLRDDWFPYLIGFGLGSHIDKWFRAFGGAASTSAMTGAAIASSGGSSSGGSSWTGFGGGGGFSGGGSSAAFAAAVGGIAASVPAPSSSGSGGGGGGGGGGSSGGGGGGGW